MPRKSINAGQGDIEPSGVAGLENIFQPERAAPWHLVLEAAQLQKGLAEAAATYRQTADPLKKKWEQKVKQLEAFFRGFPQGAKPTDEHIQLCESLVVCNYPEFSEYSDIDWWLSSQVKGYLPDVLGGNASIQRMKVELIDQLISELLSAHRQ